MAKDMTMDFAPNAERGLGVRRTHEAAKRRVRAALAAMSANAERGAKGVQGRSPCLTPVAERRDTTPKRSGGGIVSIPPWVGDGRLLGRRSRFIRRRINQRRWVS